MCPRSAQESVRKKAPLFERCCSFPGPGDPETYNASSTKKIKKQAVFNSCPVKGPRATTDMVPMVVTVVAAFPSRRCNGGQSNGNEWRQKP